MPSHSTRARTAPKPPAARWTVAGWMAAALVAVLIAAGCGSSHSPSAASRSTSPTTASGGGATATPAAGTTVTVDETEFHLALSSTSFPAGSYTFTAVNKGTITHALAITGPGVSAATGDLQPGQSASLHVTLQAGSYDVFCPVSDHKALGMNQEITVS
jgi:plastocyanin